MSKLLVFENLSLDGVMQAPAGPDEDRQGGFAHGGPPMNFRLGDTKIATSGVIIASYWPAGLPGSGEREANG